MASTSHTTDAPPTTDDVFDLLGHRYRRLLVAAMRDADGPLELRAVAEAVAAADAGVARESVPLVEIERTESMLYHSHLPKLRDHGVVSVTEDDRLWLEDRAEHLEPFLDAIGSA